MYTREGGWAVNRLIHNNKLVISIELKTCYVSSLHVNGALKLK